MKQYNICVIGGGAAGMMAAITAAREGAKVTILEAGDMLGKKILATGNGRCNLGNMKLNIDHYHGSCYFLQVALNEFGTAQTISFFDDLGLMIKEKDGYLYPYCEQASVVLDALRNEIKALGITVRFHSKVLEIQPNGKQRIIVKSINDTCAYDRVILTCGGKASPKTGSDGNGYELARKLGHRIVEVIPALTYLKCKEKYFKSIAGVRADALVTLYGKNKEILCEEQGELQLTERGISGIPVFQLSQMAGRQMIKEKELKASIDFLPFVSIEEIKSYAKDRMKLCGERSVAEFFNGIINKKVITVILKLSGLELTNPSRNLSPKKVLEVLMLAKKFPCTIVGSGDFESCQVCSGGVDCGQISKSMESKLVKGLYFAGEILDVDGRCGGYNLQWAWTSGSLAGKHAAGRQDEN